MELCRICVKRRPKRYCPGVHGDICAICCGEEREVTVNCPLDCRYLEEARRHEKPPELTPDEIPHVDIEISELFLRENEHLFANLSAAILDAALQVPGAADSDVREALDSMIKTHRTLDSGLIYTSRPSNPLAASIQQQTQEALEAYRKAVHEQTGMSSVRDKDVLGVLVFLARLAATHDNRRRLGRAFLDLLRVNFGRQQPAESNPLIAP